MNIGTFKKFGSFSKVRIKNWLVKYDKALILDVGCGTGQFMRSLLSVIPNQNRFIELEISTEKIQKARSRLKNVRNKTVDFIIADAQNIPLKANILNGIICEQVIEHLVAPQKAISEFKRILKNKGFALIGCPIKEAYFAAFFPAH